MFDDFIVFFFFKQKTAYEMRISDWSSDVCSSDLGEELRRGGLVGGLPRTARIDGARDDRDRGGDDRRDVPAQRPGRRAGAAVQRADGGALRSEEGRVGKACGSTGRSRWSPYH